MVLQKRKRSIYFIGIGGIGMSGLAELLLRMGHHVSGSDQNQGERVKKLQELGARIQIGHSTKLLQEVKADVVVYSSAITNTNVEYIECREKRIPLIRRAEMLAELMRFKRGIAVAGSHGKTTTTAMCSLILKEAGIDPTVVIGGVFGAIGSNVALGGSSWLLAEADESDGTFLKLSPELIAVTNLDAEHLNHFGNFANLKNSFVSFIDRIPFYGRAYICSDSPALKELLPLVNKPFKTFGFDIAAKPDFLLKDLSTPQRSNFAIFSEESNYNTKLFEAELSVPGKHNFLNAAAAMLLAMDIGVSTQDITNSIAKFSGVNRRFQLHGQWQGRDIIEDYAHHPTEISVTIEAAVSRYKVKPWIVYQPHRFSRTRDSWAEFKTCFYGADKVFTLPIYAAAEEAEAWTEDYNNGNFAKHLEGCSPQFCGNFDEVFDQLKIHHKEESAELLAPILILGAGDVYKVMNLLL